MKGNLKVLLLVIVIVFLVAVGFLIANRGPDGPGAPDNTDTRVEDRTRSPDQVKDSGSPNGDTTPSPTGTGPGSDNSLLSQ